VDHCIFLPKLWKLLAGFHRAVPFWSPFIDALQNNLWIMHIWKMVLDPKRGNIWVEFRTSGPRPDLDKFSFLARHPSALFPLGHSLIN
jgi:hypothetical protein